ncbi:HDOD domain-containing protein [Catenovulum sp. SM1970]|uniref:HDOD domain-containing protein n=1 Tax=Marinifaba aquimaris TaxID=2741323 RepID=UPI001572DB78|nr:HDOD domain-containing protein [Marinifaba aquimaris]NTS76829.1 HDOD domain-containing protein [Marinifaba aquimaris]
MSDMFDDLPFEGDASAPLPEKLFKKTPKLIAYTMKMAQEDEFQLAEFDNRIAQYIALGKPKDHELDIEAELAQEEANRVRLDIEVEAIRKRAIEKKRRQEQIDSVYHSIDLMLEKQLDKVITKPLKYLADGKDLSYLKPIFADLASSTLSTNQLIAQVTPCEWLVNDYIRLANSASVRNAMGLNINGECKDVKAALNIFGTKGVSLLLPHLIIEHSYKLYAGMMKSVWGRLLQFQKMTAFAAYKLAKSKGEDAVSAYLYAAMAILPEFVFTHLYTAQAKIVKASAQEKAMQLRDDLRLSLVTDYQPTPHALAKLFNFSPSLLPHVSATLDTPNLDLVDVVQNTGEQPIQASIYMQARGFCIYKTLASAQILEPGQAKEILHAYQMDKNSLNTLQAINFTKENVYHLLSE